MSHLMKALIEDLDDQDKLLIISQAQRQALVVLNQAVHNTREFWPRIISLVSVLVILGMRLGRDCIRLSAGEEISKSPIPLLLLLCHTQQAVC